MNTNRVYIAMTMPMAPARREMIAITTPNSRMVRRERMSADEGVDDDEREADRDGEDRRDVDDRDDDFFGDDVLRVAIDDVSIHHPCQKVVR